MNRTLHFFICLILSVILHASLFLGFDLISPFIPQPKSEPIVSGQKKIKVTLVEEGQRVDIIGMPTHTVQELQELEKLRLNEGSNERRRKVFYSMLKSIADKRTETETSRPTRPIGEPKVLLLAGNKISKGMSFIARKSNPDLAGFHSYLEALPKHVKAHWKLPSYLLEKNLRCRIKIVLSEDGSLMAHFLIESSGDEEFDRRAMQATKESAPYPVASEAVAPLLKQGHIILGFPE